ncbi:MAG: SDR family oxidoreductase [Clostridium sp.]|nr:SDR family oxidoreductase [Clostridium sp.]
MKKVFLTGANGDIGSAIKDIFELNGFSVSAPTRQELNLENLDEVKAYFENHDCDFDVVIHCAGFNNPKMLEDLTFYDIEKTAKINYMSFFEIVKAIAPNMKSNESGHILGISSLYGSISRGGRLAYTASKHALNGVVKTLACELGEYNILVNTLSPGFVDTKMTRKNNSDEKIALMEKKIPMKRLAMPVDIANVAYFLCSDMNTYITGQDIIVDGGFMAEGGQNS